MTDYLEELLDQLEEEEAETAAHWMDALGPALFDPLSESSGSAEPEAVGRQARSPAAQRAENGLEGPPPVQAEAQGSWKRRKMWAPPRLLLHRRPGRPPGPLPRRRRSGLRPVYWAACGRRTGVCLSRMCWRRPLWREGSGPPCWSRRSS